MGTLVIDLIWCNYNCIEKIKNFKVANIPTRSDHLAVVISLKIRSDIPKTNNKISKLMWNDECFSEYNSLLDIQLLNREMPIEIDEKYEFLVESIYNTSHWTEYLV